MTATSVVQLVPWFQVASTLISSAGVMFSIYLGVTTMRAAQRDRTAKASPNLLFDIGGEKVLADWVKTDTLPGMDRRDPEIVAFLATRAADVPGLAIRRPFGQLLNRGLGAAFDVAIWFDADKVQTAENEHRLSARDRASPPFGKGWNEIVVMPTTIPTDTAATIGTLPGAVFFAGPGTLAVAGRVFITCRDAQDRGCRWSQPVTFFIEPVTGRAAAVTVSFGARAQEG